MAASHSVKDHDDESGYVKTPEQLKDAVARLNWAEKLTAQLRFFICEYEKREIARFVPTYDETSGNYKLDLPDPTAFPPPRDMKILIGDVVGSLRKVLDYLVFELAQYNAGEEVHRTRFVIAKSANEFHGRKVAELNGLREHQIRIIEEYQPYNGGEWLELLNAMANRDKHRALPAAFNFDHFEIKFRADIEGGDYDGWTIFENVENRGADVCIRSIEPLVRLPDGRPAAETLEVMHEGVRQVLLRFVDEFE